MTQSSPPYHPAGGQLSDLHKCSLMSILYVKPFEKAFWLFLSNLIFESQDRAGRFFTLSCGYWKIMSRPKCLFQANSQWFCPQKTSSLSAISLPKTHKHTHTDMNAHIHLQRHTQIQTHSCPFSATLPGSELVGWGERKPPVSRGQ